MPLRRSGRWEPDEVLLLDASAAIAHDFPATAFLADEAAAALRPELTRPSISGDAAAPSGADDASS